MIINTGIQVKHIIEVPLDGGFYLYKNIYFLILMFWHQPKENVVKLFSVKKQKNKKGK